MIFCVIFRTDASKFAGSVHHKVFAMCLEISYFSCEGVTLSDHFPFLEIVLDQPQTRGCSADELGNWKWKCELPSWHEVHYWSNLICQGIIALCGDKLISRGSSQKTFGAQQRVWGSSFPCGHCLLLSHFLPVCIPTRYTFSSCRLKWTIVVTLAYPTCTNSVPP